MHAIHFFNEFHVFTAVSVYYKLKTTSDYLRKERASDEDLHHHGDD